MRLTTLLLFVSTGFVLAAEPASQDAAKDDAAQLQGVWSIVSVEVEGQSLAMDKLKGASLSIRGTQYSFKLDQTRLELTFKLDASKSPKTIDLEVVEGPEKGKVYRGIYKLDKGQYTICRTTVPGKDRPKEFATRANSGLMMVVWKQVVKPLSEKADSSAGVRSAEKASVTITTDKQQYRVGEEIQFTRTVTNRGKTPLEIYPFTTLNSHILLYWAHDKDPRKSVEFGGVLHADGAAARKTVAPGQSLTETANIGGPFVPSKPGTYLVFISSQLPSRAQLESNVLRLKIMDPKQ